MKRIVLALVFAWFLSPALAISAASDVKVAFIDTAQVLQEYRKAQDAIKKLSDSEQKLRTKIQEKRDAVAKARAQNESETKIQMLLEKFKLEIEPEAKKLEDESKKRSQEIETDLNNAIKEVAKENKYDFVLARQAILYGGEDVSAKVVEKLKKK